MNFKELDSIIKLPKDMNFIIYKYYNDLCEKCYYNVEYCYECDFYYCFCDKNTNKCYLCTKIFCDYLHGIIYKINFKNNLFICNNCWNINYWDIKKRKK